MLINRNASKKVDLEDDFADGGVVERTEKVGKVTKIELDDKGKKKETDKAKIMLAPPPIKVIGPG